MQIIMNYLSFHKDSNGIERPTFILAVKNKLIW
jgi:hypothetical protein